MDWDLPDAANRGDILLATERAFCIRGFARFTRITSLIMRCATSMPRPRLTIRCIHYHLLFKSGSSTLCSFRAKTKLESAAAPPRKHTWNYPIYWQVNFLA